MKQSKVFIYGKHAVREALEHAPQVVKRVHLSSKMDDKALRELIRESGVPVEALDERRVTSQVEGNAPHQGVIALVSLGNLAIPFEKFFESFTPSADMCLVLMSEVQDPHNVGAIIRSAAALGAAAVLMPTYKQAGITPAVVKASAGMAFRIPLIAMENMQQAMAQLKKKGVHIYGLAARGSTTVQDEPFSSPTLLVLGNEGEGIAPAAKALCDTMLSIPINAKAESLNVAASAAVALFAWSMKHPSIVAQPHR